jgi:hypothetical protein
MPESSGSPTIVVGLTAIAPRFHQESGLDVAILYRQNRRIGGLRAGLQGISDEDGLKSRTTPGNAAWASDRSRLRAQPTWSPSDHGRQDGPSLEPGDVPVHSHTITRRFRQRSTFGSEQEFVDEGNLRAF